MNDFTAFTPSSRVPDPAIVSMDPSFDKYRLPLAKIERLAHGFRWAEGPVLNPSPGKHIITLVDENGLSVSRQFEILEKENH